MASGIYQITNALNGKQYIGSAVDFRKRWWRHLGGLRRRRHENEHLQRAFDKYGEEAFGFSILEYVEDPLQLITREQHYLDMRSPAYNISPTAGSSLGRPCSPETHARMSAAKSGERHPNYGKHLGEETRRKISEALSGSRHPMYGKHLSREMRARLSVAQSGERHPNYGKHLSAETRKKIGEANTRRIVSEETKQKMSKSQKAYWRKVHAGQVRR